MYVEYRIRMQSKCIYYDILLSINNSLIPRYLRCRYLIFITMDKNEPESELETEYIIYPLFTTYSIRSLYRRENEFRKKNDLWDAQNVVT